MDLIIPQDLLQQAGITAEELRTDIAAWLYQRERLTLDEARRLADMDLMAFQQALQQRNIFLEGTMDKARHDRLDSEGLRVEK